MTTERLEPRRLLAVLDADLAMVEALRSSFAELRGSELFVNGTDAGNHIVVERVRERLYVNVSGAVQRFNAADVQFLSINGFGGDDVIINDSAIPSTIHGGDGHDTLWGGTGADRLRGFGGDDFLHGGGGNDHLIGDTGDDTLLGEEGIDTVTGGAGNDRSFGEAGDSAVVSNIALGGGVLTFTGLESIDEVTVSAEGAMITITPFLEPPYNVPRDLVTAIVLLGHGGDDVFNVNPSIRIPVTIEGGWGNDTLAGGTGEDVLLGEDGNDLIVGNRGGDRIVGGEGRDSLRGDAGNDSIYGEAADDTLDGGDGDDYLEAGAGHDVLTGGAGRDALFGLSGNDRLFADDGAADTVRSGPGDDSADVDDEDDVLDVEALS